MVNRRGFKRVRGGDRGRWWRRQTACPARARVCVHAAAATKYWTSGNAEAVATGLLDRFGLVLKLGSCSESSCQTRSTLRSCVTQEWERTNADTQRSARRNLPVLPLEVKDVEVQPQLFAHRPRSIRRLRSHALNTHHVIRTIRSSLPASVLDVLSSAETIASSLISWPAFDRRFAHAHIGVCRAPAYLLLQDLDRHFFSERQSHDSGGAVFALRLDQHRRRRPDDVLALERRRRKERKQRRT